MQLCYSYDFKDPALHHFRALDVNNFSVRSQRSQRYKLRSEDRSRIGVSHIAKHPDHHKGLVIDLSEQWSEQV